MTRRSRSSPRCRCRTGWAPLAVHVDLLVALAPPAGVGIGDVEKGADEQPLALDVERGVGRGRGAWGRSGTATGRGKGRSRGSKGREASERARLTDGAALPTFRTRKRRPSEGHRTARGHRAVRSDDNRRRRERAWPQRRAEEVAQGDVAPSSRRRRCLRGSDAAAPVGGRRGRSTPWRGPSPYPARRRRGTLARRRPTGRTGASSTPPAAGFGPSSTVFSGHIANASGFAPNSRGASVLTAVPAG